MDMGIIGGVLVMEPFKDYAIGKGWRDLSTRFRDLSPSEVPNCSTSTQLNTSNIVNGFLNVIQYSRVLRYLAGI